MNGSIDKLRRASSKSLWPILTYLNNADEYPGTRVSELAKELDVVVTEMSRRLGELRQQGLVTFQAMGPSRYYKLTTEGRELVGFVSGHNVLVGGSRR